MAFKPFFQVFCDGCGIETCTWAVDEMQANEKFRQNGWGACLESHYCPECVSHNNNKLIHQPHKETQKAEGTADQ